MDAAADQNVQIRIGDLLLDAGKREVRRGGNLIELPRLSFDLLRALADGAPNVVSQQALLEQVWKGRYVSPETITQRVALLRSALGDDANEPRYVAVVRGEGYRLLPDVTETTGGHETFFEGLFSSLGRRRVLQVAAVYAAISWSVTEVASFLIDALPVFPEWTRALVAVVFVTGFPVAMLLAWRFDIGPGGITRTQASSREGRLTIAGASLLLFGATAGLFYLVYPSVVERQLQNEPAANPNTVAVLPFVNATSEPDIAVISEGLGDELRDRLGRVPGLRVAARSSSVLFRDDPLPATVIAGRLGVEKIVEGTVRGEAGTMTISIEVIDGATGLQDWAGGYPADTIDILALQESIANDVARQMLPHDEAPLAAVQPITSSASANELMLLARYYFTQLQDEPVLDLPKWNRAVELYRDAIELDPGSALAHARLGALQLYIGDLEAAEEPIFRALSIDSEISEVQYLLGLWYWRQYETGSGAAYRKAIELNPNNVDALSAYAKFVWAQGDSNGAEPYFHQALELDPMTISRYADIGNFYGMVGDTAEALAIAGQLLDRFDNARAFLEISRIYELIGELDTAIGWALRAHNAAPDEDQPRWRLAELYTRIGDPAAAEFFDPEPSLAYAYYRRDYETVIDLAEDRLIENRNDLAVLYLLTKSYAATGRHDQLIWNLQREGLPDRVYNESRRTSELEAVASLASAYQATGQVDQAREVARWLIDFFSKSDALGTERSWWTNLYHACSLSVNDEDEAALTILDRIPQLPGHAWYPVLRDEPCFARFADEPRYQAVLHHVEQQKAGYRTRLPDTLATMQRAWDLGSVR